MTDEYKRLANTKKINARFRARARFNCRKEFSPVAHAGWGLRTNYYPGYSWILVDIGESRIPDVELPDVILLLSSLQAILCYR